MSGLVTEIVAGETTTTFMPTISKLDSKLDVSSVSIALAVSIVFILIVMIVTGNSIILVAFYRYKRLRTASNCLLVSLAVSDLGVGVFMPFGLHLELSTPPGSGLSTLCILPYSVLISLCSVSVLVSVAIAVDRLTSLAQPLRYKNIITHSSIEKYIAVFWIYAIAVGLSPLIYTRITSTIHFTSESCRFGEAILPPVRIFLVLAVWAPSALILLGCYMYVYLVARAHARAIYTVELSFRHQTQTLALPRYGQTLAITVGAFFLLWLPFQTCMLLDIFSGTNILPKWTIWLGLPILAHSGANPWIYAFHHGEMRIAAGKIAEDLITLLGVTPSHYGCSPTRRGSNINLELVEVNNSEERRPVEDYFAEKHHTCNPYPNRRCLNISIKHMDILSERENTELSSESCRHGDAVEENIHDLRKMLDPKYITDRNYIIDTNHNIDKLKNLKYLLDPTFNKIRHLRRLNHKRLTHKNPQKNVGPRFTSYQNLKCNEIPNRRSFQLNTMSDSALNSFIPLSFTKQSTNTLYQNPIRFPTRDINFSSLSDPNIKAATRSSEINLKMCPNSKDHGNKHRYSFQNLDFQKYEPSLVKNLIQYRLESQRKRSPSPSLMSRPVSRTLNSSSPNYEFRFQNSSHTSLPTYESYRIDSRYSPKLRISPVSLNITSNNLRDLCDSTSRDTTVIRETSRRSGSPFETLSHMRSHENSGPSNSLNVPTIHSEPPSPVNPLPLISLKDEEPRYAQVNMRPQTIMKLKSPVRHSDPVIPAVLLSIEDYNGSLNESNEKLYNDWSDFSSNKTTSLDPNKLSDALLKSFNRRRESKYLETIFSEHSSTRYSSRRPSDSKWSESSRSQEILSSVTEHQSLPSYYSVNNFQNSNSDNELNDDTTSSLDPFMCPNALSSSLHDSLFNVPSALDTDTFTSSDEVDDHQYEGNDPILRTLHSSVSNAKLDSSKVSRVEMQSRSTDSVFPNRQSVNRTCRIFRLEPTVHQKCKIRPCKQFILESDNLNRKSPRIAPLASPTTTEICTPTFDIVTDINCENNLGVRV